MHFTPRPTKPVGLYDPSYEHDACGVAMVARLSGEPSHETPPGQYGVAVCFLPQDDERRAELEALLTSTVEAEGQRVVGWRDVPVDKDYVGITANYFAPYIKQLVVAAATPDCLEDQDAFVQEESARPFFGQTIGKARRLSPTLEPEVARVDLPIRVGDPPPTDSGREPAGRSLL